MHTDDSGYFDNLSTSSSVIIKIINYETPIILRSTYTNENSLLCEFEELGYEYLARRKNYNRLEYLKRELKEHGYIIEKAA